MTYGVWKVRDPKWAPLFLQNIKYALASLKQHTEGVQTTCTWTTSTFSQTQVASSTIITTGCFRGQWGRNAHASTKGENTVVRGHDLVFHMQECKVETGNEQDTTQPSMLSLCMASSALFSHQAAPYKQTHFPHVSSTSWLMTFLANKIMHMIISR